MPPHLGWHSKNVTVALRRACSRRERAARAAEAHSFEWLPEPAHPTAKPAPEGPSNKNDGQRDNIKLYPDIALAMLRQQREAAGRIWLLLRHLDERGRGWISLQQARQALTNKNSSQRVCGWRQLRNLLRQGQGVFWERDKDRIWLRSTPRVAAALGVARLTCRPVELPVGVLCGGMGEMRAHFYASFHSGRRTSEGASQTAAPVARVTLEEITGVPPRTQREYEKCAGVDVEANYLVGEPATQTALQERAWKHGRSVFTLTDRRGIHGKKDEKYVARQLPNSYVGPHAQRPRGRQRHLNRQLADLRDKRDAGNGQGDGQGDPCRGCNQELRQAQHRPIVRRYFENGGAAAKAFNRDPRMERYWKGRRTVNGEKLWYEIAGQDQ